MEIDVLPSDAAGLPLALTVDRWQEGYGGWAMTSPARNPPTLMAWFALPPGGVGF